MIYNAPYCSDHNDQYSAQVVLSQGDNRATSNFLPEILFEVSKAVK